MTSELDKKLLAEIKKVKLSRRETLTVLQNLKEMNPKKYKTQRIRFSKNGLKFLVFTDPHQAHKKYRRDAWRIMIKDAKRQKCEFGVNCGDTIEGMSGREGHVYELDYVGASKQLAFFQKEWKLFNGLPVYSIEAQSSHGGWYHSKGDAGLNIGEELQRRAKSYKFLGFDEQDLQLDNGLKIRLRHPGGGTAYAISYKMQKFVESIGGGNKPHMIFQGHFHKANYMFYRNIHCFDAGCLQNQSDFMKKKGSPAHVGYWIIEAVMRSKRSGGGLERCVSQFVPFYD